jgi:hypothetical protein
MGEIPVTHETVIAVFLACFQVNDGGELQTLDIDFCRNAEIWAARSLAEINLYTFVRVRYALPVFCFCLPGDWWLLSEVG